MVLLRLFVCLFVCVLGCLFVCVCLLLSMIVSIVNVIVMIANVIFSMVWQDMLLCDGVGITDALGQCSRHVCPSSSTIGNICQAHLEESMAARDANERNSVGVVIVVLAVITTIKKGCWLLYCC